VPEGAERCPACGAALRDPAAAEAEDIPGVTTVDPVVGLRRKISRPNRLVGWLADVDTEPSPADELGVARQPAATVPGLELAGPPAVAPPSEDVRREMRRLELEAIRAELEARAAQARQAELLASGAAAADGPEPPAADAEAEAEAVDPAAAGDAEDRTDG